MADPQATGDITQALADGWEATPVSNDSEALAQLEQRSFDALLVDFNLGSPDASELLNQALAKRPETVRFLLAYEADLALVAAKVSGPHEILPKPVEPASLKSRIESGAAPADSKGSPSGGQPGTAAKAPPPVPAVYAEVLKALDSEGVTHRRVGVIIAGDEELTSEVVALANSAYLDLPREITKPVDAVKALGLETVKALVMALRFLAEHSQLKPAYLSLEKIWQHSTNVAKLARDLTLFETKDRALAAEALVAGLLHDLGKVVLAANFDDLYARVHSLARKQPVALWDIEKEMFGASHGEIGGCLVGMWNMPASVVEAAAFHHEPPLGEHENLTPLAAVHVANVLEHEIHPDDEFRVAPVTSPAFLNELGLLERLPVWRAVLAKRPAAPKRPARPRRRARPVAAKRQPASPSPEVEPAETCQPQLIPPVPSTAPPPRTANQLTPPAASTRTATLGQPESEEDMPVALPRRRTRWFYAGAAVTVISLVALWLETRPEGPIRALTPAPGRAPMVAAPAPPPEPPPAAVPEAAPASTVSEKAPATEAATSALDTAPEPAAGAVPEAAPAMTISEEAPEAVSPTVPEPARPVTRPEPTPAIAPSQATAPKAAPPSSAPHEQAQPSIRLNGIIYTARRPSAIMNGETVYVGDRVSGATVVSIDRTRVTLLINGQRKVLVLR